MKGGREKPNRQPAIEKHFAMDIDEMVSALFSCVQGADSLPLVDLLPPLIVACRAQVLLNVVEWLQLPDVKTSIAPHKLLETILFADEEEL